MCQEEGGYYAIKGYLFQYDKSILELLSSNDDTLNILASRNRDSGAVETYTPDTEIKKENLQHLIYVLGI